jgi:hypothetical protein
MSSRNPNHRKFIYLEQITKRSNQLFDSIEDYDRIDCKDLFNAITQAEYANNAIHAMKKKAKTSTSPARFVTLPDKREYLFDRCTLPKQGNRPHEAMFEGLGKLIKLRRPDEKQAYEFVEDAVSADWRALPCEETVKKVLNANAALGRIFGIDGMAPDNARELKNISPRMMKRCLRSIGELPQRNVSKDEEFNRDATVQRGKMLMLDGTKKRKRR